MSDSASQSQNDARIGAEIKGLSGQHDPFVSAVRATRMPMIITNPRLPDNPVVFANDAFCRLTGYTREEILGRNCRFLQGPETDAGTIRRVHDAVARGEPIEIDIRNHRKNGSPFWNRLLIAPVRDEDGNPAYFFASQVDVTVERDRLAGLESHNAALLVELGDRLRALQSSEGRLRLATEAGHVGVWDYDLTDNTLATTRLCRDILGIDPAAELSVETLQDRVIPEDQPVLRAAWKHCLDTGEDMSAELRVRGPDDNLEWVELRAQVVRMNGQPVRMAGTALRITDRKWRDIRNEALIAIEDEFRVLDDPDDLAFAAAGIMGRALGANRAGYGTVNLATETIEIHRDWTAPETASVAGTLHFRDYGSYIEDLKRGEIVVVSDVRSDPRTRGFTAPIEALNVRALVNLPLREKSGIAALFFLNHPAPRHWTEDELSFIRDVAQRTRLAVERLRAEQDLRALAASLESLVAERTETLMKTEEALRQSQKMEAVGQLTGGIAHDFNNLLTGISGSLELMQTRIAQGQTRELDRFIHAAQGAARRAASLTHRLLAFSRQQTLDPKTTGLNRLVSGMEELIRRTVGPSIDVEVAPAAGLWNTLVDPGQLENALLNLCINARDAMPDGGRLVIETGNRWLDAAAARERDLTPGQYVTLCVSDNGSGMTQDVIARAFDPFFTTKPIGMGTGLGLSMIYGFARQSGGMVRIYSEVGQGTMVCLYLPRDHGEVAEPPPSASPSSTLRARKGETVLVVDDEPTVRMLAVEILDDLGFTTIEAPDGPSGLRVLQSNARVDLLITDIGLPGGMNGRQIAEAARTLRPGLKILFITGYAENAAISHGHLEPGTFLLTKPFAIEAFEDKIRELLG